MKPNEDEISPRVAYGIEIFAAIVAVVLLAVYFRPWVEGIVAPPIKEFIRWVLR